MVEWKIADRISAMSTICAVLVFLFGIYEYKSSENWKRSEFVAEQIKEFNSDKINQSVLLLMDYDPVRMDLFPDKPNLKNRYVDVGLETLVTAISKDNNFSSVELQIREYFEHLMIWLRRFDYFIVSGAIEPKELCADFGYPIDLMNGSARDLNYKNTGIDIATFSKGVQEYLTRWQETEILHFMQKIHKACG